MEIGNYLLAMNDVMARLFNSKNFFSHAKEAKGIKSDVILLVLIITILSAPAAFLSSLLVFLLSSPLEIFTGFISILASLVLIRLATLFVLALLLHFIMKFLLKSESNLLSISIGVIYSSVPYYFYTLVLSGTWFFDIFGYIIFAYMLFRCFSIIYGTSAIKSLILAILSILVFVLLSVLSSILLLLILNILKFGSLPQQSSDEAQYLFNTAVSTNNQSLCENIHPSYEQRNNCFLKVAMNTHNASLCEKISYQVLTDACDLDVARTTKNRSLCEKISSQILKDSCISYT